MRAYVLQKKVYIHQIFQLIDFLIEALASLGGLLAWSLFGSNRDANSVPQHHLSLTYQRSLFPHSTRCLDCRWREMLAAGLRAFPASAEWGERRQIFYIIELACT